MTEKALRMRLPRPLFLRVWVRTHDPFLSKMADEIWTFVKIDNCGNGCNILCSGALRSSQYSCAVVCVSKLLFRYLEIEVLFCDLVEIMFWNLYARLLLLNLFLRKGKTPNVWRLWSTATLDGNNIQSSVWWVVILCY